MSATASLFPDMPPSLSPFMLWKHKHGVKTRAVEICKGGAQIGEQWEACCPELTDEVWRGADEKEACANLARDMEIDHWAL